MTQVDQPSARMRPPSTSDEELLSAIRRGDERAFAALVDQLHDRLIRMARGYVRDRSVAEEVVQDTWLAVLQGIDRFEGRSSLRTWIFRILMNRAISRFERERRSIPFSAFTDEEQAVDPSRFLPSDDPSTPGHWAEPPRSWRTIPEEVLLAAETMEVVRRAVAALSDQQRAVIVLRDLEGLSSSEACNVLGISETNQRVLLHRARSRVRRALEKHFDEAGLSVPVG